MGFPDLTIRLLLLFLPGIVCHFVVDALTVHQERKPYQVFLLTYVYGIVCYTLYAICVTLLKWIGVVPPKAMTFLKSLTDSEVELNLVEIGLATGLAVLVGFALSYMWNHYWLYNVARRIGVTRKFGQLNVWSFALNLEEVKWAVVRDLKTNFMFEGYIRAYSDVEDSKELFLTDVIVYNEASGEQLYKADRMYISRDKNDLTIGFPSPPDRRVPSEPSGEPA